MLGYLQKDELKVHDKLSESNQFSIEKKSKH